MAKKDNPYIEKTYKVFSEDDHKEQYFVSAKDPFHAIHKTQEIYGINLNKSGGYTGRLVEIYDKKNQKTLFYDKDKFKPDEKGFYMTESRSKGK